MSDDLLGYLFDTLDLEQQREVEARLDRDPKMQAELERLRHIVHPLAADDNIEPPLGLADQTFATLQRAEDLTYVADRRDLALADSAPSTTRLRAVDFIAAASILGVAATLVFPALTSIRGDQSRVLCAEQLRKIGVALAAYQQQDRMHLPFVDVAGPMNHAGGFAMALKAKELVGDPREMLCPAANNGVVTLPEQRKYLSMVDNPAQFDRFRRYMSGSYGYALGYRIDRGRHAGYFNVPNNTPVVADRPPRGDEVSFDNSPNHQNLGQNVLYVDGNVRWIPCRVVGTDDIFRNRNCDVAAGVDASDTVIGVSEATPFPTLGL